MGDKLCDLQIVVCCHHTSAYRTSLRT